MIALNAATYLWIGSVLRYLSMEMGREDSGKLMPREYRESVLPHLSAVADSCHALELPVSKAAALYWRDEFKGDIPRGYIEGRCAIDEIERTIQNELANTVFFLVSRERSSEFDRMYAELRLLWEKPWGVALTNLDHARFCYRADQFTACVFHCMRAAEKVLVSVAASLNIHPGREQWQNLIERVESAIREIDRYPKGVEREETQTLYSDLAMQLRYIKNAWRNHVMHGRASYDEKEAREIWWHVKRTVEKAAGKLEELVEA